MKILVVCPVLTLQYAWFRSFLRFWEEIKLKKERMYGLYMPYRKSPALADNKAVEIAQAEKYDYILRIDDDVWDIPHFALEQLLDADKEYISATAFASGFPFQKCALVRINPNDTLISVTKKEGIDKLREVDEDGIQPCDLTSFSFVLWKMSLFEGLTKPYFELNDTPPHDSLFCQKLLDAGKQPYVHGGVKVTHRGISDANRAYLYASEMPYRVNCGEVSFVDERGVHLKYLDDNVGYESSELIIG